MLKLVLTLFGAVLLSTVAFGKTEKFNFAGCPAFVLAAMGSAEAETTDIYIALIEAMKTKTTNVTPEMLALLSEKDEPTNPFEILDIRGGRETLHALDLAFNTIIARSIDEPIDWNRVKGALRQEGDKIEKQRQRREEARQATSDVIKVSKIDVALPEETAPDFSSTRQIVSFMSGDKPFIAYLSVSTRSLVILDLISKSPAVIPLGQIEYPHIHPFEFAGNTYVGFQGWGRRGHIEIVDPETGRSHNDLLPPSFRNKIVFEGAFVQQGRQTFAVATESNHFGTDLDILKLGSGDEEAKHVELRYPVNRYSTSTPFMSTYDFKGGSVVAIAGDGMIAFIDPFGVRETRQFEFPGLSGNHIQFFEGHGKPRAMIKWTLAHNKNGILIFDPLTGEKITEKTISVPMVDRVDKPTGPILTDKFVLPTDNWNDPKQDILYDFNTDTIVEEPKPENALRFSAVNKPVSNFLSVTSQGVTNLLWGTASGELVVYDAASELVIASKSLSPGIPIQKIFPYKNGDSEEAVILSRGLPPFFVQIKK